MAASSLRCVAIAYRLYDSDKVPVDVEQLAQWILPEDSLVLLAIVGMKDPCRPGVKDAVKICSDAGVKVRMVTGDNLETAKAIAFECGILTSSQDAIEPYIIEGRTFRALSEKEREATAKKITVMGRSSPNDKLLLVQALRKGGEVVAVTGDGTNDAPALHEADIGLSMGIQGTEVAKESSDIIILDDNFASVVKDRFGIAGVCLTLEMSLFNRCFRIESKEFHVRISEKGDLLFSEWSSRSVNEIHMGKYGAVWMVNMSDKLMVASTAVDFASKFTESRRGFLAQRCCNKGGRYIAVVEYGGRRKENAEEGKCPAGLSDREALSLNGVDLGKQVMSLRKEVDRLASLLRQQCQGGFSFPALSCSVCGFTLKAQKARAHSQCQFLGREFGLPCGGPNYGAGDLGVSLGKALGRAEEDLEMPCVGPGGVDGITVAHGGKGGCSNSSGAHAEVAPELSVVVGSITSGSPALECAVGGQLLESACVGLLQIPSSLQPVSVGDLPTGSPAPELPSGGQLQGPEGMPLLTPKDLGVKEAQFSPGQELVEELGHLSLPKVTNFYSRKKSIDGVQLGIEVPVGVGDNGPAQTTCDIL
ncbi:Calcium-transporting ATPase 9, plasma membrane-type [Morella rubra]|uniref:Calcium-transporting ATPase 9, plasma membrane-type n=1 Tax=Morella rubra TaxID=262757 RepID=A0A6A1VAQ5_9ROSI|nr:Calcium-transporting ATPase 9, plasma membrane-type [Morella rubra]